MDQVAVCMTEALLIVRRKNNVAKEITREELQFRGLRDWLRRAFNVEACKPGPYDHYKPERILE